MNRRRKRRLARRPKGRGRQNIGNLRSQPARASKYLQWLNKYYGKHHKIKAILYLRVSAKSQNYKKNLRNQEKVLRWKLRQLGIPVVGCFSEVISGWITDHNRGVLRQAVRKAKKYRNVVIVATSADRFLRSKRFHTKNDPDVLPNKAEFERLQKLTQDMPLITLLHPDMPWKEVRGYYTRWGQRVKGSKGGRPILKTPGWTKRRRRNQLPRVRKLQKKGKNVTEIAGMLKEPRQTIKDWIERY